MKKHIEILITGATYQGIKDFVVANKGSFYDLPDGFGGEFIQMNSIGEKVAWLEFIQIKNLGENNTQLYFTVYNELESKSLMFRLLEKLADEFQVAYAQTTCGIIFPLEDFHLNSFRFVDDFYEELEFSFLLHQENDADIIDIFDREWQDSYEIRLLEVHEYASSLVLTAEALPSGLNNYFISIKNIQLEQLLTIFSALKNSKIFFWGFNFFRLSGSDFEKIATNNVFEFY